MKLNKCKFILSFATNLFLVVSIILFKPFLSLSAKEINQSRSSDHQQNHSTGITWRNTKKTPAISLIVTPASGNGWTVSTNVKNFSFAPEKAGKKHVNGEGHIHLYVDNKKTARLYGFPHYLNDLGIGDHKIKVTLNSNDHRDYKIRGKTIEKIIEIKQLKVSSSHNLKAEKITKTLDIKSCPELKIDMKKDPVKGWNLILKSKNFILSQNNNAIEEGKYLSGFGRLYINNKFNTRIFGDVYHLSSLPSGSNTIKVELCSNSELRPYIINGKSISDSIFQFNSNIDPSNGSITQRNNTP